MTLVFVVLGITVVAGVALLIARDRPLIEDDPVGNRPLHWAPAATVAPRDLDAVRFTVALRGYRMDEVDRVLGDTRRALSQRDARIATLQQEVVRRGGDRGERNVAGAAPDGSAPAGTPPDATPPAEPPRAQGPHAEPPHAEAPPAEAAAAEAAAAPREEAP